MDTFLPKNLNPQALTMTDDSDSPSNELIERLLREADAVRKFPGIPTNSEKQSALLRQAAARIQEQDQEIRRLQGLLTAFQLNGKPNRKERRARSRRE